MSRPGFTGPRSGRGVRPLLRRHIFLSSPTGEAVWFRLIFGRPAAFPVDVEVETCRKRILFVETHP